MDWKRLVNEILTLAVAAGWLVLLVTGLEPDKPLSGGIPGHVEPDSDGEDAPESVLHRVGETVAWAALVAMALGAACVLAWILNIRG